ncbi:hypothetical protein CMUS01_14696 [Colletotrichum musicola]|uniref:NACHT domain-containing protein n=1 Tax=Colletotrichum musicola TaxID=2175873 RepID=A0A8H6MQZ7_9PEZI|nr:hypothetical protein CMUS01_14696 [Colletotrichum musicola]
MKRRKVDMRFNELAEHPPLSRTNHQVRLSLRHLTQTTKYDQVPEMHARREPRGLSRRSTAYSDADFKDLSRRSTFDAYDGQADSDYHASRAVKRDPGAEDTGDSRFQTHFQTEGTVLTVMCRRKLAALASWNSEVDQLTHDQLNLFLRSSESEDFQDYTRTLQHAIKNRTDNGKIFGFVKKVRPIYDLVKNFGPVAGAGSELSPVPFSAILGGITSILSISVRVDDYQAKIVDMLVTMASELRVLDIYKRASLFEDDPEVQASQIEVTTDILKFCVAAAKIFFNDRGKERSSVLFVLKAQWKDFDAKFGDIKIQFQRHLSELEKWRELGSRQQIRSIGRDVTDFRGAFERDRIERKHAASSRKEAQMKQEIGTGDWLMEHPDFLDWKEGSGSSALWVHGKPGSGKSHLAARVIHDLNRNREGIPLAYVYCSSTQLANKLNLNNIFGSLLAQLYVKLSQEDDMKSLETRANSVGNESPSRSEMKEWILEVTAKLRSCFIVIDALDECSSFERNQFADLCNFVSSLPRQSEPQLSTKIIVFSRPNYNVIERALSWFPQIQIDSGANAGDIEVYISEVFNDIEPDPLDEQISGLNDIKGMMLGHADGMFLWVQLKVRVFEQIGTVDGIREDLENSAEGLDDLYQQAFSKILAQTPVVRDRALKVLLWVANAYTSLSKAELLEALSVKPDPDKLADLMEQHPLLEYASLYWGNHFTAADGLRNERLDSLLMTFLETPLALDTSIKVLESKEFIRGISPYPGQPSALPVLSILNLWTIAEAYPRFKLSINEHDSLNYLPIDYAMIHGSLEMTEWLLGIYASEDVSFLTCLDCCQVLLLAQAVYMDWHNVVADLVEMGVEKDELLEPNPRTTAIYEAVDANALLTLETLLGLGADPDIRSDRGETPLILAAQKKNLLATEMLLKAGADPNARGEAGLTALHHAAETGDGQIVRILLSHGVEVDAEADDEQFGDTPLCPIKNDCLDTMRMLIRRGADIKSIPHHLGGNALHVAAWAGHSRVVEVLPELCNDSAFVDQKNELGHTPLSVSSQLPWRVTRLLLENGAKSDFEEAIPYLRVSYFLELRRLYMISVSDEGTESPVLEATLDALVSTALQHDGSRQQSFVDDPSEEHTETSSSEAASPLKRIGEIMLTTLQSIQASLSQQDSKSDEAKIFEETFYKCETAWISSINLLNLLSSHESDVAEEPVYNPVEELFDDIKKSLSHGTSTSNNNEQRDGEELAEPGSATPEDQRPRCPGDDEEKLASGGEDITDEAKVPQRVEAGEEGPTRRSGIDVSRQMWTEITQDLILRPAITMLEYAPFEETDDFFYVKQYLVYDQIYELVALSENLKAGTTKGLIRIHGGRAYGRRRYHSSRRDWKPRYARIRPMEYEASDPEPAADQEPAEVSQA